MVKIRLTRAGAKKRAFYRIVAIDERRPREGRPLEFLGTYVDSTRDALAAGARWTCPSLEVKELGAEASLVTARWVFTLGDGTVTEDYFDSYLLARVDGRWYVLADAIHA